MDEAVTVKVEWISTLMVTIAETFRLGSLQITLEILVLAYHVVISDHVLEIIGKSNQFRSGSRSTYCNLN